MSKKVIKFLISGGTAASVEYILFIVLTMLLQNKAIFLSNSVSFLGGLVVSFLLNKYWVFKSSKKVSSEFGHYFILAMVNLLISNFLIATLISLHIVPYIAKLITMAMIAAWNYFIFQGLIFKDNSKTVN